MPTSKTFPVYRGKKVTKLEFVEVNSVMIKSMGPEVRLPGFNSQVHHLLCYVTPDKLLNFLCTKDPSFVRWRLDRLHKVRRIKCKVLATPDSQKVLYIVDY